VYVARKCVVTFCERKQGKGFINENIFIDAKEGVVVSGASHTSVLTFSEAVPNGIDADLSAVDVLSGENEADKIRLIVLKQSLRALAEIQKTHGDSVVIVVVHCVR